MSREIDRRDFTVNRMSDARTRELSSLAVAVSDRMPGEHRVNIGAFDTVTGNAEVVTSDLAPEERGNYVARALNHLSSIGRALGLAESQPAEFMADPSYQKSSSGSVAVHLQQMYKGISIFQATETVRFAPNGALKETIGSSITVPQDLDATPSLTASEAVLIAAKHVATPDEDERDAVDEFGQPLNYTSVDMSEFEPTVIATFPNNPEKPTVFKSGPFGDKAKANLVWFPLDGELQLCWEVLITMPHYEGQYRTLVDGETGEIHYCHDLVLAVTARGNVYRLDGSGERQVTEFPLQLSDYGLPVPEDLPPAFPEDWVSADRTLGNTTNAHLGNSGPTIRGTEVNGVVSFDPDDPEGDDQKVLNIFYYNCFMHDFFYLLGFREADGNFQERSFGRGGAGSDRVDARAHSGTVRGTANMATPIDGSNPIMNMGLVASTDRHTAFDASVVFHEFMHGVTNRLVGGALDSRALEQPQSGGMGEGWGDYIACTLTEKTVVGDWVVNNPGGIRAFPYTSDFPDNFGDLGTGRYDEVHNNGEIWCAALLEMNQEVGATFGAQLVVDALKLSRANPSFLHMRDSILSALDDMLAAGNITAERHAEARRGIWRAFAKFGMGPGARSNGASLTGIVADFNVPEEETPGQVIRVEAAPNLAIPDNRAAGVTSTLSFPEPGRIKRLTVSVDIQHTYIGDLIVSLITPNGTTVVLHNRTGASSNNLSKSYTSEGSPALAAIVDQSARGEWTLRVSDRAGIDVGTLRKWGLEVTLEEESARGEATPGLRIPDNDPTGVASTIAISPSGTATNIKVGLDITHTYIGDLQVRLQAPSGQSVLLHNRSGGSRDNLITTFDSDSSTPLAAIIGEQIHGNWTLHVSDHAGVDLGKLNQWSIELTV